MPTWWAKEYVPFFVCVVTSAFTIGGLLFLRESWRTQSFSRIRSVVATAFKCWQGRRENPVLMYGPQKVFSAAGVMVLLIVLLNILGTWAYIEDFYNRVPAWVPRPKFVGAGDILRINIRWVWLPISVSAVLFCAIFDRWNNRLEELQTTPQTVAEITFGRFFRAYFLTMYLWVLASGASCLAFEWIESTPRMRSSGFPLAVILSMAWTFFAAHVSLLSAIRLRLAGYSVLTSLVVTPIITFMFRWGGLLLSALANGVDYTQLLTQIRGAGLGLLNLNYWVKSAVIAVVAFLVVMELGLWVPSFNVVSRGPLWIRRMRAAVSSGISWATVPRALLFASLVYLSYLVFAVPVGWSLPVVYRWAPIPEFLESPWDCLRGFAIAGVIMMWFARRKCRGVGAEEEVRAFAPILCAFVAVAMLTVVYHARLEYIASPLAYASVMSFTCVLAMLPIMHVAGSPTPTLALTGWLFAAPWFEMVKPIMNELGHWGQQGPNVDPYHWVGVSAVALFLGLRLAERWDANAAGVVSPDSELATHG